MRELELAWAAGLFDGEGYTGARKTKFNTYQISLQMHQKGREVLDRLSMVIGGQVYTTRRPEIFKWNIGKKESVIDALNQLWPFLSTPKRNQILAVFTQVYGDIDGV